MCGSGTIEITVTFNGPMKRPWPDLQRRVELPRMMTIGEALLEWGFHDDDVAFLKCVVNGRSVEPGVRLNDQDDLAIFLVVGGG